MNLHYLISSVFCMLFAAVPIIQGQVPPSRAFPLMAGNKDDYKNMDIPIKYIKIELFSNIPAELYPREFYNVSAVQKGTINLFHYLTDMPPFPLQYLDAILIPFVQGEQFMTATGRIPWVTSVMGLRYRHTVTSGNQISVILPDGTKIHINRMHFILKEQLSECRTVADVYQTKLNIDGKKVSISDIGTVIIDGINYMDTCGISYQ